MLIATCSALVNLSLRNYRGNPIVVLCFIVKILAETHQLLHRIGICLILLHVKISVSAKNDAISSKDANGREKIDAALSLQAKAASLPHFAN